MSEKVQESLSGGDHDAAYKLLVDHGVHETPDDRLKPEHAQAKQLYTDSIENLVVAERDAALVVGHARAALGVSRDNIRRCPWSERIKGYATEDELRVGLINDFIAEARLAGDTAATDESLLRKYVSITHYLSDSPIANEAAKIRFARFVESALDDADKQSLSGDDLLVVLEEICRLTHIADVERDAICRGAELEEYLHVDRSFAVDPGKESVVLRGLAGSPVWLGGMAYHSPAAIVKTYAKMRVLNALAVHTEALLSARAARHGIESAEKRFGQIDELQPLIERQLGEAHIRAAADRANGGIAAFVALVHIERARSLIGENGNWHGVQARSLQSIANAVKPDEQVFIEVPANLEPGIQNLVRSLIVRAFLERSNPLLDWEFVGVHRREESAIEIDITEIDWRHWEEHLSEKTSRYMSHFQEVANPRKASLKSELDSQEWSVSSAKRQHDSAESSYESAVRSHNSYPTDWSLDSALRAQRRYNNARNSYVRAVDQFNTLVGRYNATPVTISKPVYMAYIFTEGEVSHGVSLEGSIRVRHGELARQLPVSLLTVSSSSMQKDWVRRGTKNSDVSARSRRDDPLDIDVSLDKLLDHAYVAVQELLNDSYTPMGQFVPKAALAEDLLGWERRILAARMHPMYDPSRTTTTSLPKWSSRHIDTIELPPLGVKIIEEVVLLGGKPKSVGFSSLAEVVPRYGTGLVKIQTATGSGSGAIVSKQGHILTCAHVIQSTGATIYFPYIDGVGSREAKVIYASEKDDVAILLMEDPPSQITPIPIALDEELVTGEKVVAIGNPALGDGEFVVGAVTIGHVARAAQVRGKGVIGQHLLDVTVASGSSGGPVIRFRDGLLVGVTTAVYQETLNRNRAYASSGNMALAAPADQLDEILLLRYE